jgi:hypothetical protein
MTKNMAKYRMIVALFGPQQVGKTTAANSLVEHHGFVRVAFAEPIYRMVGALLNLSVEEVRKLPKDKRMAALGYRTLRYTLQTLGTEWGREFMGRNLWVDAARREIQGYTESGKSVVIDDLRFKGEYEMLRVFDCRFVRLHREGAPHQEWETHRSELDWYSFESHADITNPPDGAEHWGKLAGDAILAALRATPAAEA